MKRDRPDYDLIRWLEYELGFEERPAPPADALLKEVYSSMGALASAAVAREMASVTGQAEVTIGA